MPYSLKGRNVLVTGGSRGLGELVCLKFAAEGSNVMINYVSAQDRAEALSARITTDFPDCRVGVVKGDMGVEADCVQVVEQAIAHLGGLDIIISNAGWTRFSTFADLGAPTTDDWDKTFAINVKAQTHLLRTALPTFKSNPTGGVFLITSSIAGLHAGGSSMPYSVSKAAQLHLMKCLAQTQAPHVRVNAVCPGLLLTEWGQQFDKEKIQALKEKALLKNVTDLDDCAQIFIDLAKNTSMTGQKITVDSGLCPV